MAPEAWLSNGSTATPPAAPSPIAATSTDFSRGPSKTLPFWIDLALYVAGLPGDAHLPLDGVITGLQLIVGDRPFLKSRSSGCSQSDADGAGNRLAYSRLCRERLEGFHVRSGGALPRARLRGRRFNPHKRAVVFGCQHV